MEYILYIFLSFRLYNDLFYLKQRSNISEGESYDALGLDLFQRETPKNENINITKDNYLLPVLTFLFEGLWNDMKSVFPEDGRTKKGFTTKEATKASNGGYFKGLLSHAGTKAY